ncbi:restriction endonuclease [Thermicanus aegyptius]|uniref:restriction endonuclease n=1 Tax=Thermicanus aegyptius TaxID=94009 RepID=UPI00048EFA3A|nr:restriction endonuclease [Thermicanus aegyptius]
MFRLGIMTGVLLMLFALKEGRVSIFLLGLSLVFSFLVLLLVKQIGWAEGGLLPVESKKIRILKREWRKSEELILMAKDWIDRFAERFTRMVKSPVLLTPAGEWFEWEVPGEEGEDHLLDLHLLLEDKGIHLSLPLLRVLINRRILETRWARIELIWNSYGITPPTIDQVMAMAMERGRVDVREELWTPYTLFYTLKRKYKEKELRRYFLGWKEDPLAAVAKKMNEMEEKEERKRRMSRLELFLSGKEGGFHLDRFDQQGDPLLFSHEVEALLLQMGYRKIPTEEEKGFCVERSGVRYLVLPLWCPEGGRVNRDGILEAHALRSMAKAHTTMVVTNRGFVPAASSLASRLGVILVDRERLQDWLYRNQEWEGLPSPPG